ncbi:PilZ domain-containing protein [Humisphaera borealis]|uniref:PilZ domain-containing protein n=1 Tax=Humisphaera borealis TaxID=2807512 RepID=A0A7M2X386_9BACT|nr:PilZ domain-containing protein [Humisphaera borealis]QOV92183.1 PilZ domain-containing protein [Humisphaera borealis]
MELTACLFEQVIRTLRADVGGREQRRFPRVGLRAKATIYPDRIGLTYLEPREVWVKDLSLQGIGLTSSASLPVGIVFEIRLAVRSGSLMRIRYTVIRTRSLGTVFSIGAELLELIDAVELPPLPGGGRAKPLATLAALTRAVGR